MIPTRNLGIKTLVKVTHREFGLCFTFTAVTEKTVLWCLRSLRHLHGNARCLTSVWKPIKVPLTAVRRVTVPVRSAAADDTLTSLPSSQHTLSCLSKKYLQKIKIFICGLVNRAYLCPATMPKQAKSFKSNTLLYHGCSFLKVCWVSPENNKWCS